MTHLKSCSFVRVLLNYRRERSYVAQCRARAQAALECGQWRLACENFARVELALGIRGE